MKPLVRQICIVSAFLIAPAGIVWHELAGHGLMGLLCGGRITRVQCFGVQFAPNLAWTGLGEGFGAVDVVDIRTRTGENMTLLAGSTSTLLAAIVALAIFRRRQVHGASRVALTCAGLWSLDIVTFTLPSLGVRRYIVFGSTYSEPFDAAVALGIPGRLFQWVAIGGGLIVLAGFFMPRRASSTESPARMSHVAPWIAWLIGTLSMVMILALVAAMGWYARTVPAQPFPETVRTNWSLDPATRVRDWQEDIDYLVQELPQRHRNAFFACSRGDFETAAAKLRDAVPDMADDQVAVALMKLVALLGDGHTSVDEGSLRPAFQRFPLSIYIFSDGPVVVAASEAQKDLVGCSLVTFSGVRPEDAFQRVAAVSACENEATLLAKAPKLLCVPEIASAVGLIPTTNHASIVVRDRQGNERTVELTPMGPAEKFVTVPVDQAKLPLSRQKHPHQNWFQLIPDQRIIYLRYNTCADEPDQSVAALTDKLLEVIDANQVRRVIVDLRGNGGGDSGLFEPFIAGLKRRKSLSRARGVVVLIGRNTFSSAHMHANDLKRKLGAVLIGEPTGQKPNAYGDVRWFVLPRSQIFIRYSTKYWRTTTGDPPSLDPDIFVRAASADYFDLRDPVLETALGLP